MRRIRPATIVSSFCAAVDGGRAAIVAPFSAAGDDFLPTNPKPKPHTKPPSHIFGVFVRNQLQNEERARKILLREYSGRATKDENDELADEEKVNTRKVSFSREELYAFENNLENECETDYDKYDIVYEEFLKVIKKDGARLDKLAEIAAQEELDAFVTNSFATKLMHECDPKYVKRFREVIEKVRKEMIRHDGILKEFEIVTDFMSKCNLDCEKLFCEALDKKLEKVHKKMIQDDGIMEPFKFVTYLMSKFEPHHEKLLCEVLEKVREKFAQDDKGGNDNTELAKLDMNEVELRNFEKKLDEFVTDEFLTNLRSVEEKKSYFMAYEVIEKVAKEVGNENLRKLAEEKLDALVTNSYLRHCRLMKRIHASWRMT